MRSRGECKKGRTARKSGSSFYNRGWRDFGLLFEQRPVAGLAQLGPLLILGVRLELVVVAVRRFLNGEVVPGLRVRVVRPDRHVREKIILGLGLAVQHAVDERHGLGTGDVALGTKRAVGITRDDAHGAEGRDRGVVPGGGGHVGVAVGLGQVLVADVVGQQTEEDGRDLGAGDVVLRADLAVAVADNIGEVIGRVQTERIIIGDHDGGRRVGARGVVARPLGVEGDVPGHGSSKVVLVGELLLGVPASEGVAALGGVGGLVSRFVVLNGLRRNRAATVGLVGDGVIFGSEGNIDRDIAIGHAAGDSKLVSGVAGDQGAGNAVGAAIREGLGVSRLSLSTIGVFVVDGQIVLLQCDFTGGDGEVDGDILVIATLDRQGRGTVEGVVAIVLLGIDCRGVDLDGVGLGVGVSGNEALARLAGSTGQIPVSFEITADAGHAVRQRVVDRAAGKTGGDA